MTRTAARLLALQLSFAANAGSDLGVEDFFDADYFCALPPEDSLFAEMPGEKEKQYILSVVNGVREHREELDGYITRYSRGWKISRMSKTALGILRCAMYEIIYMPEIPAAASINEAVELDKRFDDQETVSFVNGILDSFMKGIESSQDHADEAE